METDWNKNQVRDKAEQVKHFLFLVQDQWRWYGIFWGCSLGSSNWPLGLPFTVWSRSNVVTKLWGHTCTQVCKRADEGARARVQGQLCWPVLFVTLTQLESAGKRDAQLRKCLQQILACRQIYRVFLKITGERCPNSLWVAPALGRWVWVL